MSNLFTYGQAYVSISKSGYFFCNNSVASTTCTRFIFSHNRTHAQHISTSSSLTNATNILTRSPHTFLQTLHSTLQQMSSIALWAEETLFLPVYTFFWGLFSSPTLFAATGQQPSNLFMISFLSRTIDFFFFFLSLWTYLWLAETSQQPISQTTWLKVTPHCNHCSNGPR